MTVFDGIFEQDSLLAALDILVKLGIGAILGGAIGWEREISGRPAGIRTHMLVVIGVVLFAEVSRSFEGDPGRVAAQIVTGVGFLGAGTIMRVGTDIKGLTTAASIWAAAGIGMAVSVGGPFLLVAAASTILVLLTLAVVDNLEKRINPRGSTSDLRVDLENRASISVVLEAISQAGGEVRLMRFTEDASGLHVSISVKGDQASLVSATAALPGVVAAAWGD